jgi:hypothetical protein
MLDEFGAENINIRGNEIFHRCNLPFGNHAHGDTTGKAHLNFEKLTFSCWVCGGGGFLWWLSTMRGEGDAAVRDWLAKRTGLGGVQDTDDLLKFLDALLSAPPAVQEKIMPRYDARILDQWRFIHPYLTEFRHIPTDNVIASNVGYGSLSIPMGDGKFQQSERITIPHFWKGELVGWQSRRLTDDGTPKYMSTPSFPKDITLYNYDQTAPMTVVVEAPISVVAQRHVAHFEATFGAAVTTHQLDLLSRHSGDILLWMDNDPAGWNAMEQMCEYLSRRTSRLYIVDCPFAADPGDLDSDTVALGLSEWRVPWMLWQRPKVLSEWRRPDADQEVRSGESDQR